MSLLEQEKAIREKNQRKIRIALLAILVLLALSVSAYVLTRA